MKSRITIEVDFENGNLPIIQILSRESDDVRDNLIKQFLQSLQHTSRWCRIEYLTATDDAYKWAVVPITPKELISEIDLMRSTFEKWQVPPKGVVERFMESGDFVSPK